MNNSTLSVREVFELIKNTPGSNDKKTILNRYMSPTIKKIFEDTYSDQMYYVKKYNITSSGSLTIDENYDMFHAILVKLSTRELTGNLAIALVETIINSFVAEDQWILNAIMERNLKIGLSLDNFDKVTGNTKKFEVALAHNLDKVKNVNPCDGTYFASRKLDGCRTICKINNYIKDQEFIQEVKFYSRSGKEFTTLSKLIDPIKSFTSMLMGEWVLDGECCIMEGENENFNLLMREITRKNHTIENPKYKIFDIITIDEFEGRESMGNFETRYNDLIEYYYQSQYDEGVQKHLEVLEQERVISQEVFDKWVQMVKDNNWEGFMLRKNTPYKSGRTKDLLKVKKFQDAEYIVEDVITGKVSYNEGGTKEYDVVTAIVINHKGTKVQVGSGLSKEQRLDWYSNPNNIIGKTVTIQYFEETINKNDDSLSLRFPVLKYVYENGRNC